MDTTKHTVTIPYTDYMAMKECYEKYTLTMRSIELHKKLIDNIQDFPIRVWMDFNKIPIKAIYKNVTGSINGFSNINSIRFEYER